MAAVKSKSDMKKLTPFSNVGLYAVVPMDFYKTLTTMSHVGSFTHCVGLIQCPCLKISNT